MTITKNSNFLEKIQKLQTLIKDKNLWGILIESVTNIAWLTGGRAFISIASEKACASIIVEEDRIFLLSPDNETQRLLKEEFTGIELSFLEYPWNETPQSVYPRHNKLTKDSCLNGEITELRSVLTPLEIIELKKLGQESAEIVEQQCRELKSGTSELAIAGKLCDKFWAAGIEPLVLNIAGDERAYTYRHPVATAKTINKQANISVAVRRKGLHVTFTRIVYFGAPSEEFIKQHKVAIYLESCAMELTRPGIKVNEIFLKIIALYETLGFANEWQKHPIGGLIGFQPREYNVTGRTKEVLKANQAFCWNPTINGTKSEDTFLITDDGMELITHTGNFVYIEVDNGKRTILRPDILLI